MINRIISPLTLAVPAYRDKNGNAGFGIESLEISLLLSQQKSERENSSNISNEDLANSIEIYLLKMVSNCAVTVDVPYQSNPNWLKPNKLRSLLSPSLKKTVNFIDSRSSIWNACTAYLQPLVEKIGSRRFLDELIWYLYLLALSAKYKAEVVLPPENALQCVLKLGTEKGLDSESKFRLAKIEGLFKSFNTKVSSPVLNLDGYRSYIDITERIDEILEDAYLLEASQIKRFFGLNSNKAALKRDLRKILGLITSKRSWAKGLVSVGSTAMYGSDSSDKVLDNLLNIIPQLGNLDEGPVLTGHDTYFSEGDRACIEIVRSIEGFCYKFGSSKERVDTKTE